MNNVFISVGDIKDIENAFADIRNKFDSFIIMTTTDKYDDKVELYCAENNILALRFSYKDKLEPYFLNKMLFDFKLKMVINDVTRKGSSAIAKLSDTARDSDNLFWLEIKNN